MRAELTAQPAFSRIFHDQIYHTEKCDTKRCDKGGRQLDEREMPARLMLSSLLRMEQSSDGVNDEMSVFRLSQEFIDASEASFPLNVAR